ncbi:MAG: bifunctional glutamate N-acetyltransferase/amino-acid acetyltransferase ArgJ [Chlorobi bacterium]|nr:bifunctional glutamate N-acetyltransferase/amino-acid acetyltransferase ArgJ [Chlorobiota bacterium]
MTFNLQKAQDIIDDLSASTSWPAGLTPRLSCGFDDSGFWPEGFHAAGVSAGIRYDKRDVMLLYSEKPASAAAVFTTNLCCAAPVTLSREHLRQSRGVMRALICNSGNANAATGQKGMDDASAMADGAAELLGVQRGEVLVASTGVIGQPLPMPKILAALPALIPAFLRNSGLDAAEAIMTTDTFPKFLSLDVLLSSGPVRISGIAKGSGMICPDMATMLAFLATDANIEPALLQRMLREANERSFNAITVDGDTSTNDMVSILAAGSGPLLREESRDTARFAEALGLLMTFLAKLIVIDGEGATKLVEIRVEGALSVEDAQRTAKTIANSPLVKTALHGQDANWGRIIAAAGRSGATFRQEEVAISFDGLAVLKPGFRADFSEEEAAFILKKPSYAITVRLGDGPGKAVVWTCDLSKEYIEINGSYRS